MKMEKLELSNLGAAKKVTVTKDNTIVLHGGGDKKEIQERCDQIREAIATTTSDYDRCAHACSRLCSSPCVGMRVLMCGHAHGCVQAPMCVRICVCKFVCVHVVSHVHVNVQRTRVQM